MGTVALIHYQRRGQPSLAPETRNSKLSVLNWISLCFVRETQGDVVAAAFSAQSNELTLWISHNRGGKLTQPDLDNASRFLSTLRRTLQLDDPDATVTHLQRMVY